MEKIPDTMHLIDIWKKTDIDSEFLAIDLGENAGVVRRIPFGDDNNPGVVIDERYVEYNSKTEVIICPKSTNDVDGPKCVLSCQICPIKGLIDVPMFKSFLSKCTLPMDERKKMILTIYENM
ncbi:hypothetical protein [Methanolobus sp. ZRKC5]|uniref:hypothetical protein n=1 Tax=Methanolobus sp. ZRKC5 TaxID=3136295 RepID=UPI00313D2CB7